MSRSGLRSSSDGFPKLTDRKMNGNNVAKSLKTTPKKCTPRKKKKDQMVKNNDEENQEQGNVLLPISTSEPILNNEESSQTKTQPQLQSQLEIKAQTQAQQQLKDQCDELKAQSQSHSLTLPLPLAESQSQTNSEAINNNRISLICRLPLDRIGEVIRKLNITIPINVEKEENSNIISKVAINDKDDKDVKKNSTEKLLCLYCEKQFTSQKMKLKHIEKFHTETKERRCSERNTHCNNIDISCNESQTSSHGSENSQFHIGCSYCRKGNNRLVIGFEQDLDNLFLHMTECHSEKYFGCRSCRLRFPNKTKLNKHLVTHHNDVNSNANDFSVCDKIFEKETFSEDTSRVSNGVSENSLQNTTTSSMLNTSFTELRTPEEHTERNNLENFTSRLGLTVSEAESASASSSISRVTKNRKKSKSLEGKSSEKNLSPEPCTSLSLLPNKTRNNNKLVRNPVAVSNDTEIIFRVPTRTDSVSYVFDDNFYKEVIANVRNNILFHLDGKLPSSNISEVSSFTLHQPCIRSTVVKSPIDLFESTEIHAATSIVGSTAFPTLLTAEQYAGEISRKLRRPITKNSWKWKWDSVKKYKLIIEGGKTVRKMKNPLYGSRDLSKLDMWTQLEMRKKHETRFSDSEGMDELEVSRGEKLRQNDHLNFILDRRLLPNITLEQSEQAVIKLEFEDYTATASCIREDCSDSLLEQGFNDSSFLSLLNLKPNNALVHNENKLILSGEWARPRCYLCMCCGDKFDKLKSLEEHKVFRHSHIMSTHYEVVGRELLAGNLLCHLFIPKRALSRYDSLSVLKETPHRFLQWKTKDKPSTSTSLSIMEDESSDSLQSNSRHGFGRNFPVKSNSNIIYELFDTDSKNTIDMTTISPSTSLQSCSSLQLPSTSNTDLVKAKEKEVALKSVSCTKCSRKCNGKLDMYRHMLDCSGDYVWSMVKKRKYRYYCGTKRRRPTNKLNFALLGRKKKASKQNDDNKGTKESDEMSSSPVKTKSPPRPRPSDAETIKKMLENLPPKRVTKKIFPTINKTKIQKNGKMIGKHKLYNSRVLRMTRSRQLAQTARHINNKAKVSKNRINQKFLRRGRPRKRAPIEEEEIVEELVKENETKISKDASEKKNEKESISNKSANIVAVAESKQNAIPTGVTSDSKASEVKETLKIRNEKKNVSEKNNGKEPINSKDETKPINIDKENSTTPCNGVSQEQTSSAPSATANDLNDLKLKSNSSMKRSRRINDCIAMLTGKLEEKLKTAPPPIEKSPEILSTPVASKPSAEQLKKCTKRKSVCRRLIKSDLIPANLDSKEMITSNEIIPMKETDIVEPQMEVCLEAQMQDISPTLEKTNQGEKVSEEEVFNEKLDLPLKPVVPEVPTIKLSLITKEPESDSIKESLPEIPPVVNKPVENTKRNLQGKISLVPQAEILNEKAKSLLELSNNETSPNTSNSIVKPTTAAIVNNKVLGVPKASQEFISVNKTVTNSMEATGQATILPVVLPAAARPPNQSHENLLNSIANKVDKTKDSKATEEEIPVFIAPSRHNLQSLAVPNDLVQAKVPNRMPPIMPAIGPLLIAPPNLSTISPNPSPVIKNAMQPPPLVPPVLPAPPCFSALIPPSAVPSIAFTHGLNSVNSQVLNPSYPTHLGLPLAAPFLPSIPANLSDDSPFNYSMEPLNLSSSNKNIPTDLSNKSRNHDQARRQTSYASSANNFSCDDMLPLDLSKKSSSRLNGSDRDDPYKTIETVQNLSKSNTNANTNNNSFPLMKDDHHANKSFYSNLELLKIPQVRNPVYQQPLESPAIPFSPSKFQQKKRFNQRTPSDDGKVSNMFQPTFTPIPIQTNHQVPPQPLKPITPPPPAIPIVPMELSTQTLQTIPTKPNNISTLSTNLPIISSQPNQTTLPAPHLLSSYPLQTPLNQKETNSISYSNNTASISTSSTNVASSTVSSMASTSNISSISIISTKTSTTSSSSCNTTPSVSTSSSMSTSSKKESTNNKGKPVLKMDDKVISHIDDAINSVINAVKASIEEEEMNSEAQQSSTKDTSDHSQKVIPKEILDTDLPDTGLHLPQKRAMKTKHLETRNSLVTNEQPIHLEAANISINNSLTPSCEVVTLEETNLNDHQEKKIEEKTTEISKDISVEVTAPLTEQSEQNVIEKPDNILEGANDSKENQTDRESLNEINQSQVIETSLPLNTSKENSPKSSDEVIQETPRTSPPTLLSKADVIEKELLPSSPLDELKNVVTDSHANETQSSFNTVAEVVEEVQNLNQNDQEENAEKEVLLESNTPAKQEIENKNEKPLEGGKEKLEVEKVVEEIAEKPAETVAEKIEKDPPKDVEIPKDSNNESVQIKDSINSSEIVPTNVPESQKKQRRRRKNELAAIVADQLLESFKIDSTRRDNLKKLENLAYEKSEDLLLTGMLLMSSTKRSAAEKSFSSDNLKRNSKTDDNDKNTKNSKRANSKGEHEGKKSKKPYKRRDRPLDNENISKLKSSLESFSLGIETKLNEYEAKKANLNNKQEKNGATVEPADRTVKSNCILRPSLLSATYENMGQQSPVKPKPFEQPNNLRTFEITPTLSFTQSLIEEKNQSTFEQDHVVVPIIKPTAFKPSIVSECRNPLPEIRPEVPPQPIEIKNTVYSRDPRLNRNMHKVDTAPPLPEPNEINPSLLPINDRFRSIDDIADFEEDNYLTEIAKNVNEKIMSAENEDFISNDGFELAHDLNGTLNGNLHDDSNSKYYRPPTSLSVRSAPNFNDDHSNFGSMVDDNTNTEVMDMDLDDNMSVYTSYSQDLGRGRGRRRRRRRSILLKRKPKKQPQNDSESQKFECVLCKKTFYSLNSLSKHNMTLAHVSKVSEQEYLMSKSMQNPIEEPVAAIQNEVATLIYPIQEENHVTKLPEPDTIECTNKLPPPTLTNISRINNINSNPNLNPNPNPNLNPNPTPNLNPNTNTNVTITPTTNTTTNPNKNNNNICDIENIENPSLNAISGITNMVTDCSVPISLNPDERLFFECCTILKGAETISKTEHSVPSFSAYNCNQSRPNLNSILDLDEVGLVKTFIPERKHENGTKRRNEINQLQTTCLAEENVFKNPPDQQINRKRPCNFSNINEFQSVSENFSGISEQSAVTTNNTMSRFKTKAAMKGYENVNVNDMCSQRDFETKSTNCKLTDLADIALGTEKAIVVNQQRIEDIYPSKVDNNNGNKSKMPCNEFVYGDIETNLIDKHKNSNISLNNRERTKNNAETQSSTSSKTIMHSSIIKAAVKGHSDGAPPNKIIIPERPFKNIGLEEKEFITFQKPKVAPINLLNDDNSVSTGSYSDRDDYDFGTLSCDEEDTSMRPAQEKLNRNNSPSDSSSSRATAKTFENKSLIMGRIFKNAQSTKARGSGGVGAGGVGGGGGKVKSVGIQNDQLAPPPIPAPKADLNQLFDELRGDAVHEEVRTRAIQVSPIMDFQPIPAYPNNDLVLEPPMTQEALPQLPLEKSKPEVAVKPGRKPKQEKKPKNKGRKDISKLQSELGMSPDEIEKLIDDGQRKSKRSCTANTQRKLVEMWSSDEYEEFLSTKDIIALIEEKEQKEKKRKRKTSINTTISLQSDTKEKETPALPQPPNESRVHKNSKSKNSPGTNPPTATIAPTTAGVMVTPAVADQTKVRDTFETNYETNKKSLPKTKNAYTRKATNVSEGANNDQDYVPKKKYKVNKKKSPKTIIDNDDSTNTTTIMENVKNFKNSKANKLKDVEFSAVTPSTTYKTSKRKELPNDDNNLETTPKNGKLRKSGKEKDKSKDKDKNKDKQKDKEKDKEKEKEKDKEIVQNEKIDEEMNNTLVTHTAGVPENTKKRKSYTKKDSNKKQQQQQQQQQQAVKVPNEINEVKSSAGNSGNNSKRKKSNKKQQSKTSAGRKKRPAAEKLYYWSSSSEDEDFGKFNNTHTQVYDDDDVAGGGASGASAGDDSGSEHYQKHGWIVGDSHKKLVTLLAIAKGNKKGDNYGVKKNTPKKNKN